MNIQNELRELDAWLEGREDIDNEGGPNVAMRVRQLLASAIPAMDELVEALEAAQAYVDDAEHFPEQFKRGVVKRHADMVRSALRRIHGVA